MTWGSVTRTQVIGEGMDLTRGGDKVEVRLQRFSSRKSIRVSVRHGNKSTHHYVEEHRQTLVFPGINLFVEFKWPKAKIEYIAPAYRIDNVEFDYHVVMYYTHISPGDHINVNTGKEDTKISIESLARTSASIKTEDVEGIIEGELRYINSAFLNELRMRIPWGEVAHRDVVDGSYDRIGLIIAANRDYKITGVPLKSYRDGSD